MLQPAKTMASCKEYAASQLATFARPTNISSPVLLMQAVHNVQMNVDRVASLSLCRHNPTDDKHKYFMA